jgi:transitional endoplasmic reticulum ATPase
VTQQNRGITLNARLTTSPIDARRGVVRLHPEVLEALALQQWEGVRLTGSRVTVALAAEAGEGAAPGFAWLDDVTMSNTGLTDGAAVVVEPVDVAPARSVRLTGSRLASTALTPETLRLALIGKVVTAGDAVSLLPQDLAPPPGTDLSAARRKLAAAIGTTWTNELLTVASTEPPGAVAIGPSSVVGWRGGAQTGPAPAGSPGATAAAVANATPVTASTSPRATLPPQTQLEPENPSVPVEALIGHREAARMLTEWMELTFTRPELLVRLGGRARLAALVSGPEGVGKSTLVRSVSAAVGARVVELVAPSAAALEPGAAAQRVQDVLGEARAGAVAGEHVVLLVSDVEALAPAADPPPMATLTLDALRAAVNTPGLALVATTARPESVDPRLRDPDLIDRELRLPLPDTRTRGELLRRLLLEVPVAADVDLDPVVERTPGFVAADLIAVRREAAVRAALRHRDDSDGDADPRITQEDLLHAVATIRPTSMSDTQTLRTGGLSLDDVGDMAEVKQALTEAVLWPLQYPDSFARLGVDAPHGVLLYGPPGGGKTFLVRALAGTGKLNVFSVKGAELLDKYVGESERAVRELFRKAEDAAPALLFFDELDALAPRRGQSGDSGVADRVVAALLTELDGVEPLRDVVILGATNRPELVDPALLRPGRLERLVYVPPPDAQGRADILRTAARNIPLAPDVDLTALATELEGYSAADCVALLREAALTAMRESLQASEVTAEQLAAARRAVGPSLDPLQVAQLASYAETRRG